jgi:hypothetical protein
MEPEPASDDPFVRVRNTKLTEVNEYLKKQHQQIAELTETVNALNATLTQERADAAANAKQLEKQLQLSKADNKLNTTRASDLEGVHTKAKSILQSLCSTLGVAPQPSAKKPNQIKRLQSLLDDSNASLRECHEKMRQERSANLRQKRTRATAAEPSDGPAQLPSTTSTRDARDQPPSAEAAIAMIVHSPLSQLSFTPDEFAELVRDDVGADQGGSANSSAGAADDEEHLSNILGGQSPISFYDNTQLGDDTSLSWP